jgi:histidine decarboxylase
MPPDPPTTTDSRIADRIAQLAARLDTAPPAMGFPGAHDIDWQPLAGIFCRGPLNNFGDPWTDGLYPLHAKDFEREAIHSLADLLRAPPDDRWGYVASGATEAILCALELARRLYPDAVVYHSAAAHPAVAKAISLLAMRSVVLRTDDHDQLDYADLAGQVGWRRHRPVVVVATAGTTMCEAVDDLHRIHQLLDRLAVPTGRRFVVVDAALAGIPLATLDPTGRPGFDLADGADAVIISGHKFLATPMPCAALLLRASTRARAPIVAYTAAADATISSSRHGHAALAIWYALTLLGRDGLAARAQQSRQLAAHLHTRLCQAGWPAWRHPHAITVTLAAPPQPLRERWKLFTHNGRSHIVCTPGTTRDDIDAFCDALATASQPTASANGTTRAQVPRQLRGLAPPPTRTTGNPTR